MKTNTTKASTVRQTSRKSLGPSLFLAATALLMQGCTTARPAWVDRPDANPVARSAFAPTEPREGLVVVSLKF